VILLQKISANFNLLPLKVHIIEQVTMRIEGDLDCRGTKLVTIILICFVVLPIPSSWR
jgi:hypothetical protein